MINKSGLYNIHFRYIETLEEVEKMVSYFEHKDYIMDRIHWEWKNKVYKNIEVLEEIANNYSLCFDCGIPRATYEEFVTMQATFRYYKELLTSFPLSPIERVMHAYNLMKS